MAETSQPQQDCMTTDLTLLWTFDADEHDVRALAWPSDGRQLLAVAGNGTAWLWDIEFGEEVWRVQHGSGVPSCVAWSPDGRYWLVGTWQGTADLAGASSGAAYETYRGLSEAAIGVSWSSDGNRAYAVSSDGELVGWEAYSRKVVERSGLGLGEGHGTNAAWSPGRRSVAVAFGDGRVACRDLVNRHRGWSVGGDEGGTAHCTAWSPDGLTLACAAEGGVRVWSASDGEESTSDVPKLDRSQGGQVAPDQPELPGPTHAATWAAFSHDGLLLAARTRTHVLLVWRCGSWELSGAVEGVPGTWTHGCLLAFHPRLPLIASVDRGSLVRVWDASGLMPRQP